MQDQETAENLVKARKAERVAALLSGLLYLGICGGALWLASSIADFLSR